MIYVAFVLTDISKICRTVLSSWSVRRKFDFIAQF